MNAKNIGTSSVIIVAAVSLIGLCWVQYNWLQDSIKINREIFEQKIDLATANVKEALNKDIHFHGAVVTELLDNHKLSPETSQRFKAFIDSVMVNMAGLDVAFDYGIYTHNTPDDTNLFQKMEGDNVPDMLDFSDCPATEEKDFGWASLTKGTVSYAHTHQTQSFHYHLGLFFTSSNLYLISEMKGPLLTAFTFIILLILCFSYTIITIRKQKRLSQIKNDFINNLTHEFKTPIFSIDLVAGMLKKSDAIKSSERLSKYVDVIDAESKRLKNQVDKVLQMALVDSGNFKLEKKEIDLHQLISKVAENFRIQIADRKGVIDLNLKAKNNILLADETHLKNIIYNLLDNAQKYCSKAPHITISSIDDNEGLIIKIQDNGIGMDERTQRFIFDKFYRADSSDIHNVKGFGLGLSYVKSVIDAHQAKINLSSSQNTGSTFTLRFGI
ncbi:HAMP domain-containing sensor histidine kinase [Fulvivirga sp.]|uniref:sensor histidine kinase n=1 Tax=Fulvivirga sp. TaxID=1931237 RepID=UPI0032F06550